MRSKLPARLGLALLVLGLAAPLAVHAKNHHAANGNGHGKPKKKVSAPVRDDSAPEAFTYGRRADVVRFAAEAAERRGLDPAWVEAQLAQARFQPAVARLIMPPPAGTAKNWAAYRARFVEPNRVRAGAMFWEQNARWLEAAESQYGVPASVVVGILGVETYYGRIMGNFRVLDALATLAFDFPAGRRDRSAFFRGELEELLVLAQREGLSRGVRRITAPVLAGAADQHHAALQPVRLHPQPHRLCR
jgi:membrane-bound lytic murein transglycosylase B